SRRFVHSVDGEGLKNIPAFEPGFAHPFGRLVKFRGAREFGRDGVNFVAGRRSHTDSVSITAPTGRCRCTSDSGKTIFTSLIAIIGRKRMKRTKRERKIPWVPIKVQISTQVGMNKPHELGSKSRCNPPTMMMKRSNHIPAFTHIETK